MYVYIDGHFWKIKSATLEESISRQIMKCQNIRDKQRIQSRRKWSYTREWGLEWHQTFQQQHLKLMEQWLLKRESNFQSRIQHPAKPHSSVRVKWSYFQTLNFWIQDGVSDFNVSFLRKLLNNMENMGSKKMGVNKGGRHKKFPRWCQGKVPG